MVTISFVCWLCDVGVVYAGTIICKPRHNPSEYALK